MQPHHHLYYCAPTMCKQKVFIGFVLRGGQTRTDVSRSLKEMLHLPTVLPALNRNHKPGGLGEILGIFVQVSSKAAACAQGRPEFRPDRFRFFPQTIPSLAGSRQVGHEVCRLFAFLKGLCNRAYHLLRHECGSLFFKRGDLL